MSPISICIIRNNARSDYYFVATKHCLNDYFTQNNVIKSNILMLQKNIHLCFISLTSVNMDCAVCKLPGHANLCSFLKHINTQFNLFLILLRLC